MTPTPVAWITDKGGLTDCKDTANDWYFRMLNVTPLVPLNLDSYEVGKKDGWEACEVCHGIVDGKIASTALAQLQQARADALREAAGRIEQMANGKSPAAKLRRMADEISK